MKALGCEEVAKLSSVKIAGFFSLSILGDCSYEHEALASVALSHREIGMFLGAKDSEQLNSPIAYLP